MSRPCSTFLNEAFTDAEKSYIPLSKIKQEKLSGPYEDAAGKDMYYSVGRISIINETSGWDITAKSPVRFDFEMNGTMDANYKIFFNSVDSKRGSLDFAVSLTQNRSGVPIIICHPEIYTPNYPEGKVRHQWGILQDISSI